MVDYTIWTMKRGTVSKFDELPTAYALWLKENVAAEGFPEAACWEKASAIRFERDWRGEKTDPQRATEVQVLWNEQTLFLRFFARYRELHVFPDARADGWRDELWERDVAEAFLQPEASEARVYKELEVSPNGFWIDLNIAHGQKEEMRSGLRRRVVQDAGARTWTAELAVPMRSLTPAFDPKRSWRANFFRAEGKTEPRFYAAWSPTLTPEPNFHVPEAFGHLVFFLRVKKEKKICRFQVGWIMSEKNKMPRRALVRIVFALILSAGMAGGISLQAQESANPEAPAVKKVEPPNWWVGLTPEVMLLLSGKNLRATHVSCNLRDVIVGRTQSSGEGDYLFVWLKLGPDLHSGTAVCRITTAHGETTFELPIASRSQILGRNQGISLDDVIYLIMPDRFANGDPLNDEPEEFPGSHDRSKPRAFHGGDLRGVEQHLDYLKDLGVTTLWLTPIVKNGAAQDYHGYGAVDLYAVDPHLGTLEDYQELVQAAHKQHMKVFFDVVPNHVGPRHPWAAHPPMPDWFHGTPEHHLTASSPLKGSFYGQPDKKEITNDVFESLVDPHTPPQLRRSLTEGWFGGILPDMNTENPAVVQYLAQNSIWWAETAGLDGYRIDTFPYVSREFWEQWHTALRRIYPRLSTIGEVFHPDPTVTSFYQGGRKGWDGIDTQLTTPFDFPLYFALRHVLLKGAPAGQLANILRQDSLYPHPEFLVPFFGNHDTTRLSGTPEGTPARLKLAFGLIFTVRGIPEMYYGDEIGMPGGRDPDNRRDFPGGWTEDAQNAFKKDGRTREQEQLREYVRSLLQVRAQHPALRRGQLWSLASDDATYVFMREAEEERIVVAFHAGEGAREIAVPLQDTPAQRATGAIVIFGPGQAELVGKTMKLRVPGQSVSVFLLQ